MLTAEKKNDKPFNWLLLTAIIFFLFILTTLSAYFIFEKKYEGKIYPNIYIGDINFGGQTLKEAEKTLKTKTASINQNGINFYYGKNATTIFPIISSLEGDIAYSAITLNEKETLIDLFGAGRKKNFKKNLADKISAILFKKKIYFRGDVDEKQIEKILTEEFSSFEALPEDAKLEAQINENNIEFNITEERTGLVVNYQKGVEALKNGLRNLTLKPISLTSETAYPQIYKKDTLNIKNKADNIISAAPLILKYDEKNKWIIEKKQLSGWLGLKINSLPNEKEEKITIGLNNEAIEKFLTDEVAKKINKTPIEAKFKIKDGKVSEFQAGQEGLELNIEESLLKIENIFTEQKTASSTQVELIVKKTMSAISVGNINDMGIKEIIGTGESNFSGSPKNRRHNIKVGANALSGLLIKPGEEFSTIKALGKIDGSAGYLPELVIKGNRTIPEFGGGLCQVGTTMFRTALASGMPITARRNHSYRVVYYEPAGTDATIYDPAPDFKFINDTKNYILIQTRIEGDSLYFDFWGERDGRLAEKTKPTIYNITKPGPTKEIETTDLKPGEKKCTEKAHNGADAYFDYKVTYANGEIKENRFSSHYIPWRAVCLIGVEKLSEEKNTEENKNATNSENENLKKENPTITTP